MNWRWSRMYDDHVEGRARQAAGTTPQRSVRTPRADGRHRAWRVMPRMSRLRTARTGSESRLPAISNARNVTHRPAWFRQAQPALDLVDPLGFDPSILRQAQYRQAQDGAGSTGADPFIQRQDRPPHVLVGEAIQVGGTESGRVHFDHAGGDGQIGRAIGDG